MAKLSRPRRARVGKVRIGVSGWVYPPWRGVYYPRGLPHARELGFVSRHFSTLEVNGSFYGLLRPSTCIRWNTETPDDFVFAVKGSRFITHMKRLRDCEVALANFFASGILALGHKLGPILWQLPASVEYERSRLESFLALLPRTLVEAAELARRHDHRLDGRNHCTVEGDGPLRHVLEPRDPSFGSDGSVELLRSSRIALCVADTAGKWPAFDEVTTDFVYVRLHGDTELYVSGYEAPALDRWAERIETWRCGREKRDVYVYFDNDARVRAPFDAQALAARLGAEPALETPDLENAGEPARTRWPDWVARRRRSA